MEKKVLIKEDKDSVRFVLPLEFDGDFSDDEKIKLLQSYFREMVCALLENKTEEEFFKNIADVWKSKGYIVRNLISTTFTSKYNILSSLPEMMIHSALKLLGENSGWPPNLSAAIVFCVNAMEIVVNNKLIDRFNQIGRLDKVELVQDDKGLSLEDKFTWLLNDAFGSSLKNENTLWTWFLDIKGMRNKVVHLKKDSDGTDITLNDKNGNPRKKLDATFAREAIEHTLQILNYLKAI
ncbi:MAG: hypothetical protein NT096_12330 [Proteobacteria bacterium]|nr:hypothetical protein [Pseudomonadota bacterium]